MKHLSTMDLPVRLIKLTSMLYQEGELSTAKIRRRLLVSKATAKRYMLHIERALPTIASRSNDGGHRVLRLMPR